MFSRSDTRRYIFGSLGLSYTIYTNLTYHLGRYCRYRIACVIVGELIAHSMENLPGFVNYDEAGNKFIDTCRNKFR